MTKLKPNQILLDGHLITEIPLLFQTEMVKANLEYRKTQTRRANGLDKFHKWEGVIDRVKILPHEKTRELCAVAYDPIGNWIYVKSPYGKPGDLLWVRETFGKWKDITLHKTQLFNTNRWYEVDGDRIPYESLKWKPSIHMPKLHARIWVMVEEIRVERVQDISEEDAKAEGCIQYEKGTDWMTAKYGYQILWENINGENSWNSNPWVWVIRYRILSKTGRPSDEVILKNHLDITGQLSS